MERMIRKIKIDLQVIMIIWAEETKPLSSLYVFFLLHSELWKSTGPAGKTGEFWPWPTKVH